MQEFKEIEVRVRLICSRLGRDGFMTKVQPLGFIFIDWSGLQKYVSKFMSTILIELNTEAPSIHPPLPHRPVRIDFKLTK